MTRTSRPTFFKYQIVLVKVQRSRRKLDLKAHEKHEMDAVRRRDVGCRVPFCGCKKLKMRLEVAHEQHRGAGGNPDGTRTDSATMVRVCFARHRTLPISLDKGTLRWVPLSVDGANGRIAWQVDMNAVNHYRQGAPMVSEPKWTTVAEEGLYGITSRRAVNMSAWQTALLLEMAEMRW